MRRLRQIWQVAAGDFLQWKGSVRIGIVFALAFVLCFLLTEKSMDFAQSSGVYLQIAEPFVWAFGDGTNILMMSCLLIVLFADAPFLTAATAYTLYRTNRLTWLLGTMLYMGLATLIFVLFVFAATCLLCVRLAFPDNQWSDAAKMLGYSGVGKTLALPAAVRTLEMSTPYAATGHIFILMLLYSLLLSALMMAANLWKGAVAGIVAGAAFTLVGYFLSPQVIIAMLEIPRELYWQAYAAVVWISPVNHATFSLHNFGYDQFPRLWQSWLVFGLAIAAAAAASLLAVRRYEFHFTGTDPA